MKNNLKTNTDAENTNLEPGFSERGFAFFEPTLTDYGAFVTVSESSSAESPKLWLDIKQPEPEYGGQLEAAEATAHMTLDQAKEIHAKLGAGIELLENSEREFIGEITAEDLE